MPGLFSRIKNWTAKEVLTYTDLNAEFNNIITNCEADTLGGYSASVPQMQSQVDPGDVGSESRPTNISGEIERLRYVIKRITGETYWYEPPARSLSAASLKTAHIFSPSSSNNDPIQLLTSTGIEAGILSGAYDGLDFTVPGKFASNAISNPSGFNRMFSLDPGRLPAGSASYSFWFKGFSVNETILYNGTIGLRVYLNASGYIQADITKPTVTGTAKDVVSVTGNVNYSGSTTYRNLIVVYKLSGTTSDCLKVYVDGVSVGTPIESVAIHSNVPTKNETTWLMGNFSGTVTANTNMNAVPDSLGWTKTSTGGSASVSGGVLSVTNVTATTQYWSRPVAALDNWVRFKFRLKNITAYSNTYSTDPEQAFSLILKNSVVGARISISPNSITLSNSNGLSYPTTGRTSSYNHNFLDWTVVTVNQNGSATTVMINDRPACYLPSGSDLTAALVIFGKTTTGTQAAVYEMEYINFGTGYGGPSANTGLTQALSDFVAFEGVLSDSGTINNLQTSSPINVFGPESDRRIKVPNNQSGELNSLTIAAGATSTINDSNLSVISDGRTPITMTCNIDVANANSASAGSATAAIWFEPQSANIVGYSNWTVNQAVSQSTITTAGAIEGVMGNRTIILSNIAAGNTMPVSTTVTYSGVIPAGEYSFKLKCYVHTGSLSLVFRRFEYTTNQG